MPSYAQVRAMFPSAYDETPYAWIITKDYLYDDDEYCTHSAGLITQGPEKGSCADCFGRSEVGTRGPSQATDVQIALANACGLKFRMYDDDHILYYEGYIWSSQGNIPGDEHFSPLDDFGAPNAGCTTIFYKSDLYDYLWVPL